MFERESIAMNAQGKQHDGSTSGWRSVIASLVATVLVTAGLAAAQSNRLPSTFRGKVLDPAGAAVVGAQVSAGSPGNVIQLQTVTDAEGVFAMTLPPGNYVLRISADGFQATAQDVVMDDASGTAQREFVMALAPHSDSILVRESADGVAPAISSGTKTLTPLQDVPQSITLVTKELIRDQSMQSIGDVVRYIPGITAHQGENNRDQVIIRGNSSSADFYLDGVRDDVQYYRDLYDLERVEALKGPNALVFGRGGAGGVINRVTKEAGFSPLHELTLQAGSHGNKRFAADFDQPINDAMAFRLNSLYESSGSFRPHVNVERYGVSPTLTILPNSSTKLRLGYEYFHDGRVADRGIPSFQGLPVESARNAYFGDPDQSRVRAQVHFRTVALEHQFSSWVLTNRTLIGDYDRKYQNFVPGAVTADQTQAALSAYNNATKRRNLFNQTDAVRSLVTGPFRHTLLGGAEVGRQLTDNFRNTGFFNNTATSILVPLADPTINTPMTFRQSATDADNHVTTNLAAVYFQDQLELTPQIQFIGGLRLDHFDLNFLNNRNGEKLQRVDNMLAPRAGIVYKPVAPVSVYGSYGVSYLPSAGDQFSSLTSITQTLKPERFNNYEVGVKWERNRSLAVTGAVYRLDRVNTRATDPNDPTRIVQTGSQRTNGFEVGVSGNLTTAWKVSGGYSYQDAFVTSATSSAIAGAKVAQVPHHNFALWDSYRFLPRWEAGLGLIYRSDMFAAIDNTVTLPGYTRADAAVFYDVTERTRVQVNVENFLNRKYFINADGNNNISPGSPVAVRAGLTMRF